MEDKDTRDLLLLNLPPSMPKPSQSQSSVFELVSKPRSPPLGKQAPSSTRQTLAYSRKKATILELV